MLDAPVTRKPCGEAPGRRNALPDVPFSPKTMFAKASDAEGDESFRMPKLNAAP